MMKASLPWLFMGCLFWIGPVHSEQLANPLIDASKFRQLVVTSEAERAEHRLTEAQFLEAMQDKNIVILDARSAAFYKMRHIVGAVNLPFTEFTEATLAEVIPSKDAKIIIYCNNNFTGSPVSFASKAPAASLNLSTYHSLKAYGYTNIFELGPLLHVDKTAIPFAGNEVNPD